MRLHETTAAPSPPMTDAPLRLDQEAARQHAERPFEDAHALVGDEAMNAGIAHQRFDKGDDDGVVGADEFDHGLRFSGCGARVNGRTDRGVPRTLIGVRRNDV